MAADTLRGRARQAVQAELADAAQDLFLELGFEATTVDRIAAAAGMSRRSFFRYFSSKEELVVGKYGWWVDDMVADLRGRPATEPAWEALRRTFDRIVDYYADPGRRERVVALEGIVATSPSLHAASLAVFHRMQMRFADVLVERDPTLEPAVARVTAAAAWAALQAALGEALATDPDRLAARVDAVMSAVRPGTGTGS